MISHMLPSLISLAVFLITALLAPRFYVKGDHDRELNVFTAWAVLITACFITNVVILLACDFTVAKDALPLRSISAAMLIFPLSAVVGWVSRLRRARFRSTLAV